MENIWQLPAGGYLLIDDGVLTAISRYCQSSSKSLEAGGILLGYRRDPHIEVLMTTFPKGQDIRTRTYFERRDPSHQRFAKDAWEQDRCIHYLGEWHTHPEATPSPSSLDKHEWKKLGRCNTEILVMLIVGTSSMWLGAQYGPLLSPVLSEV